MRSLAIVLQDVEDRLSEPDLDLERRREIKDITEGCGNVLRSLKRTVDKYSDLQSSPAGVRNSAKRTWKRLKWEPDDIKELRGRIISNIALWNAYQRKINR